MVNGCNMFQMKTWTLLLACLWMVVQYTEAQKGTTCPCGDSKKGRIIGGTQTAPTEFPWVVRLVKIADKKLFCSGVIINYKAVISVASCGEFAKTNPANAVAGSKDADTAGQIAKVKTPLVHEKYNAATPNKGKSAYDIAVFFLETPFKFDAVVSAICLPTGKEDIKNKWVKALGWGRIVFQGDVSKHLLAIDVQANPCGPEPKTYFCFKAAGKSACHGDSGGPVVYLDPVTNRYTLLGLIIGGDDKCEEGTDGMASEVGPLVPWIRSKTSECHKA